MSTGLLLLSLCPAIAMTDTVIHSLWMSAGVILVSLLSTIARDVLDRSSASTATSPKGAVRLLRALLISSVLTAAFEAGLLAVSPTASASMGIYSPLIAVNVLVIADRQPAARSLARSASGALGRGLAVSASLLVVAIFREALGAGTITLFPAGAFRGTIIVGPLVDQPVRALGLAGGALLCLGYLAGALQAIATRRASAASEGEKPR